MNTYYQVQYVVKDVRVPASPYAAGTPLALYVVMYSARDESADCI